MSQLVFHFDPFPASSTGHMHSHAHIIVPMVDEVIVTLKGQEYAMPANQLFFIPPDTDHFCQRSNTVFTIDIPASMIKKRDLQVLKQCLFVPISEQISMLIGLIKQELASTAATNADSGSMRYLYYYLYDKLVSQYQHKSIQYIHQHFHESISIQELAELENYNATYFTDWFKKRFGTTPSQYIRKLRMDKARELLTSSDYRVIDVAVQVGYSNNAAFSKAFKEVFNCTPLDCRKNITPSPQVTT